MVSGYEEDITLTDLPMEKVMKDVMEEERKLILDKVEKVDKKTLRDDLRSIITQHFEDIMKNVPHEFVQMQRAVQNLKINNKIMEADLQKLQEKEQIKVIRE